MKLVAVVRAFLAFSSTSPAGAIRQP